MSESSSTKEYNERNEWRDEATLRRLYLQKKLTLEEIAAEYDITHQAVLYWMDKHGIETRNPDPPTITPGGPEKGARQLLFCLNCGDTFPVTPGDVGERKFCSKSCSIEGYQKSEYKRQYLTCETCEDNFYALPHRKYCSHRCYAESLKKENTSLNERYRKLEKAAGWREAVFERDDYRCQRCGCRGGDLQAHHITPVSEIVEEISNEKRAKEHRLFNDPSNGLTLCLGCHEREHSSDGETRQ